MSTITRVTLVKAALTILVTATAVALGYTCGLETA